MLTTPLLDSPTRCPQFEYRATTESAEETSLAVLRVYTVDKAYKKLVALGAVIVPLYVGEEPQVNIILSNDLRSNNSVTLNHIFTLDPQINVQGRSLQTLYTIPCNDFISHGAQVA